MRIRNVLFILAAILVVAFALLNWEEVTRATTLNLGLTSLTAPLGVVLLGLLVLATVLFVAAQASAHTRHLMESRQNAKALQAQRELAENAEASRFVELRQHLDEHLRETRQRETQGASQMEQTVSRLQRELRQELEQFHRAMTVRLGEMEARLTSRIEPGRSSVTLEPMRPTPIREEVHRVSAERPMASQDEVEMATPRPAVDPVHPAATDHPPEGADRPR
jgi:uncharacterized integral membrane protein